MRCKKTIQLLFLILNLAFSCDILADNAPIITISIDNPKSIPFIFAYNNNSGNVCVNQSSTIVKCTIHNKQVLGFILNLSWINTKNINCGINVRLFGDTNSYLFQFSSTYNGTSFTPQQWDGKSDLEAKLIVGTGSCT